MTSKVELNAPEEVKGVGEIQMSRTDKPDEPKMNIDFNTLREKIVFDEMGNKIRFGDVYKRQKTIIVFSRVCFIFTILVNSDYIL